MTTPEVSTGEWRVLRARGWELSPQLTLNKVSSLCFLSLLLSIIIIFSNQGELILIDKPLFTVPDSAHTDDPEDLNRVLSCEVENLTEADREYFYSLADCKVTDCF